MARAKLPSSDNACSMWFLGSSPFGYISENKRQCILSEIKSVVLKMCGVKYRTGREGVSAPPTSLAISTTGGSEMDTSQYTPTVNPVQRIAAIPTLYHRTRFRSRLEARWAVFLDCIGIEWRYEFEGYTLSDGTLYLPDFYLPQIDWHAEVKPKWPTSIEIQKCRLLAMGTRRPVLFLDDQPDAVNYWALLPALDLYEDDTVWCDVVFQDAPHYAERGRLFASTGEAFHNRYPIKDPVIEKAVTAALSYQFGWTE